ncbi:MAG: PD-(D/E)XK nuclease family protein [Myxococcaceae bacterium]
MARRLLIVPDADRVEQWLLDASRHSPFVDLRDTWTLSELMSRLEPAARAKKGPADPLTVQMIFARATGPALAESFGQAAHGPEFAAQVRDVVAQLRAQAASPRQLEEAAARLDGPLADRARAVAVLWRSVDETLARLKLADRGDWWSLAVEKLDAEGLPRLFRDFESIEVRWFHDVPKSRLLLFEALAAAARKAGVAFSWRYPASGDLGCDAFVIDAVRQAEARWQSLDAELAPELPDGELAWLGPRLFGVDGGSPRPARELTAFCAPTWRDELREIARRTQRLVNAGVPPEAICIALRDVADDTELIVETLSAYGVPARARRGVPLTRSVQGRVALSLLGLADDGFPADRVATVLECRAVTVLSREAADPRAAFREAGIRDELLGAADGQGAYARRLASLAERSGERRRSIELLAEGVQRLLTWCRDVPAQGTALELLEAWWDTLSRLGLLEPVQPAPARVLTSAAIEEEFDRALAREQAAVDSLAALLGGLKDALATSGLSAQFMTRADFAHWVRLAASELNLEARGPRAGAVWVLDLRELPGRRFVQVFVGGLVDGRLPGRSPPLPVFSEEERVELNRAAKAPLFRVGVGEGDVRVPARLAEDRLLFHLALSSAASVTVSRARFDDGGRELLPSAFWQALGRAVEGFREEHLTRATVPALDDVQTEAELRTRVALEALSPAATRQTVRDPRASGLEQRFGAEPWFGAARQSSAMEQERLRFFSDATLPPGPFSGAVTGGVLDALQPRLAWDEAHPLSAHELHQFGTCAFRGLSRSVLGLSASNAATEELDSADRGRFWHEVLAAVVGELDRAGALGKDDPASRPLIERTVDAVARRLEHRASTGHPELWKVAREWAVTVIHRLVCSREARPFGQARPKWFEVSFGTKKSPPELQSVKIPAARGGERDVFLTGQIDRIDEAHGVVGVVDYKTSVRRGVAKDLLVREFQMPFYLLAVRALAPDAQVNGAWHAVGRNQLTTLAQAVRGLSVTELLATDELTRARLERDGASNLANSVFALVGRLREGQFGARPVDCEHCELKPVCRISDRRLPEENR